MNRVIYKKKAWNVLCPANLEFISGCIQNILIERNHFRVIIPINICSKIIYGNSNILDFC